MDLYPSDGTLPGIHDRVIEDHELNPQTVFATETAGFSEHPAALMFETSHAGELTTHDDDPHLLVEKMGVSDPECDK